MLHVRNIQEACIIGVKRNAERYKFWEPRLRVDPVWARSRRSRFSLCDAQPDLNFLVTFAKRRTFGPKIAFWAYFPTFGPKSQFWGPKRTFGSKIDFGPKRPPFWLKFHLVLQASATWGRKNTFSLQNSIFAPKITFWLQNCIMGPKSTFEHNFHFLRSVRAK